MVKVAGGVPVFIPMKPVSWLVFTSTVVTAVENIQSSLFIEKCIYLFLWIFQLTLGQSAIS